MTAAVVLAAGLGTRLKAAADLPKWLVPVGDTCPAEMQLSAMVRVGIADVLVVVAPGGDAIESMLRSWRTRLSVELVVNEQSAERNNWYSLLLGLERWLGSDGSDVVVINSDLYASTAWFEDLLRRAVQIDLAAGLAVDPARGHTAEAMKVSVNEAGRHVTAIGKVGIDHPGGEYVGLGWWHRAAAIGLVGELGAFLNQPHQADHWYEHAIQEHIQRGAVYGALPVPSGDWVEIDDDRDLEAAHSLLRESADPSRRRPRASGRSRYRR